MSRGGSAFGPAISRRSTKAKAPLRRSNVPIHARTRIQVAALRRGLANLTPASRVSAPASPGVPARYPRRYVVLGEHGRLHVLREGVRRRHVPESRPED